MAQFKTIEQTLRVQFEAQHELALVTLNKQLSDSQIEVRSKQTELEALIVRLENLEASKSADILTIEDMERRYKLQIHTLKKENADLKNRFNIYCQELTIKLSKQFNKTESQLLVEIERLKANERAIVIEQQQIA